MKIQNHHRWKWGCLLAAGMLASGVAPAAASRLPLTRSLYVPVRFELCAHLSAARMYLGEQPVGDLPTERIFQFTYYPELRRVEPEAVQIRVVGERADGGTPFLGRLAVTPGGVFTAERAVRFDLQKEMARLSYKLDVRYQKRRLRICCDAACPSNRYTGGLPHPFDGPPVRADRARR
jgi:hypothetical protein